MKKIRLIKGVDAGFDSVKYRRKHPERILFVSEEELLNQLVFQEKKNTSQRDSLVIAFIVSIILLIASSLTL